MPRATVITDTIHRELKSCPGGFVELKQLSYSEMLARRDIVTRMSMRQGSDDKINVELANLEANRFSFRNCIVDHNLEDEHGRKLDFTLTNTLAILDPKIGVEIERYIDELNQDDDEAELADFTTPAFSSSEATETELSSHTE